MNKGQATGKQALPRCRSAPPCTSLPSPGGAGSVRGALAQRDSGTGQDGARLALFAFSWVHKPRTANRSILPGAACWAGGQEETAAPPGSEADRPGGGCRGTRSATRGPDAGTAVSARHVGSSPQAAGPELQPPRRPPLWPLTSPMSSYLPGLSAQCLVTPSAKQGPRAKASRGKAHCPCPASNQPGPPSIAHIEML